MVKSQLTEIIMPLGLARWYYNKLLPGKILDVGCCSGDFGLYAPKGFIVYGVDLDKSMLVKAANYEIVKYANVEKHIPFKNNFFDNIFCRAVMEHIRDYKTFMKELYRVLRPGGILIITCGLPSFDYWNDYDHFLPHSTIGMKKLCEDFGFKILEIRFEGSLPWFGVLRWQSKAIYLMNIPLLKIFRTTTIIIAQKILEAKE